MDEPRIPMLDLTAQNAALGAELSAAVERVVASGRFVLGEEVERFEQNVARFLGVKHAVGVSSGSDALVCALLTLGVGAGDEVITTPFSFFATVEAILRVGATPRFVDVTPDTLEMDPALVAGAITPRTRAIIGVALYGEPGRIDRLAELSASHGVPLVEDAAQAFGARLAGRAVGSFGAIGCFSFQPTKPLGAWGDAGLLVTNDAELAERCRRARVHGAAGKHRHLEIGGNYRLDALQAAVLDVKLGALPRWLELRRAHARAYTEALRALPGLTTPPLIERSSPSCSVYTLRVCDRRRDALARFLSERGIDTAVHYPTPLHRQPALLDRGCGLPEGALPNAELAAEEVLSIPLFPELTRANQQRVVDAILEALAAPLPTS